MKISEVLEKLEKVKSEFGDIESEVRIYDCCNIRACEECIDVFTIKSSGEVMCIISGGE